MRILAIVNPVAGRTCKYWPAIKSVFRDMEYDFEVQHTEERGHATAIAAENNGFDVIASVGGDGTLNEIINGIMGRDIVLSVIPTGTGNDFVKSAGLVSDCIAASRSISQDVVRSVDAGCVTFSGGKRYFIGVAGMGFDGLVSKTTSQVTKPKMGTVPYVMGILKHLADYRSIDVSLTVDDVHIDQKVMFVDVANGKYVGAGMNIAPHAEVDDGLFDIIVIGDLSRLESLVKLPTLYRGTHLNNPKVGAFRGRHVELHSHQPLSIHVEGEYIGDTPATFHMYEKALKFSVPPLK
ncbi:MAG: diacylglycerol kinase family lipid kinase [Theionarchaea archaeon]|nr:diacylglycerol kinase family lipid kinase [Theionarchaea archaeon]MBU7036989.1 diacylglycerol kinase family lipid kinase [Theionarchaea archaeon]